MLAQQGGSVFYGRYTLAPSNEELFTQYFKNETITKTIGGAIDFKNMNEAGLTIIEQCNFKDNFALLGGSINMEEGGSLFAFENTFELDKEYLVSPKDLENLRGDRARKFNLKRNTFIKSADRKRLNTEAGDAFRNQTTILGYSINELIHEDSLTEVQSTINVSGQIRQKDS